jgi:predicted RNA-binding Zn-ribbon protein involved in translation (DUF1610 family)
MKKVDKCTACGGDVVEQESSEYDPSTGPMVIGPGSKSQYKRTTSYFCADCGIVYVAPPKSMKKRRKAHGIVVEKPTFLDDE